MVVASFLDIKPTTVTPEKPQCLVHVFFECKTKSVLMYEKSNINDRRNKQLTAYLLGIKALETLGDTHEDKFQFHENNLKDPSNVRTLRRSIIHICQLCILNKKEARLKK